MLANACIYAFIDLGSQLCKHIIISIFHCLLCLFVSLIIITTFLYSVEAIVQDKKLAIIFFIYNVA